MKRIFGVLAVTIGLIFSVNMIHAQQKDGNKGNHDFRAKSLKMSERLSFTEAQKVQLKDLNAKYVYDDYDKKSYRKEFRNIMTEEQKQKALEMRRAHGRKGKPAPSSIN